MTTALVVDDSQFERTVVGNVLGTDGYEVRMADSDAAALRAAEQHQPDLVTINLETSGLDGGEIVAAIVRHWPTRILAFSDDTDPQRDEQLAAVSAGAVETLSTDDGALWTDLATLEQRLTEAVRTLERADLTATAAAGARSAVEAAAVGGTAVSAPSDVPGGTGSDPTATGSSRGDTQRAVQKTSEAKALARAAVDEVSDVTSDLQANATDTSPTDATDTSPADVPEPFPKSPTLSDEPRRIDRSAGSRQDVEAIEEATVVIGASTGGPRIVEDVLAELPAALAAKVLVVQHMPASFTDRLAQRLDERSAYTVREAEDGDGVSPGEALIARGGRHLSVESARQDAVDVALTDGPRRHGVRPSIDVTMETLAEHDSAPLVGVVLTGMGKDGAAGITELAAAGATTIAQDEATSPVFGIPRRAIETGTVDRVLPASDIATGILNALTGDSDG